MNNLPTVEEMENFLLNLQKPVENGYASDLYAIELAKAILVYIQAKATKKKSPYSGIER